MPENKTQPTNADVHAFITGIEHKRRHEDSLMLFDLMGRLTAFEPLMWGKSIVGYGQYHYKYASGREGDFLLTGFSPRKAAMTIYIMPGFERYKNLLTKLGKHKISVSCLYITRLDAVDLDILEEIIGDSVERMKTIYPDWSA
ncbi:MAG: DUF1801 domain-containing protein [Gammaproteobacteria bacterium]|nr:DUF1801 domain-containing protein [Gammaproteobacteria bacterium]